MFPAFSGPEKPSMARYGKLNILKSQNWNFEKQRSTKTVNRKSFSALDLHYKVASHAEIYNFVVEGES